ncbi:MAG: alpha/beta hydrolase [Gemmatimonadales bacterium]|nr:alpha/beta hydrolase [Gemmatimonadales bacterium]
MTRQRLILRASSALMPTLLGLTGFLLLFSSLPTWAASPPAEDLLEGRGEYEMVLIHGLGSSADVWDGLAPYLMGTFKVFRFELTGHGTTQPMEDPSITKEVERLSKFLFDNDLSYPTLVGHGLGGMIALNFALDYPADVHRLILMDAAPRQLVDNAAKVEITNQILGNYGRFVAERFLNMSPQPDITEIVLDQALRTDSASFISLLMSSFDYDVTDRLRGLSVPMLIIGSELMFPLAERNREVLNEIGFGAAPSLSFKRMGKTGHFMMLEQPVYIASVLLAFGVDAEHRFEE